MILLWARKPQAIKFINAKYEVAISYGSKIKVNFKDENTQRYRTDQYDPDYSIQNTYNIKHKSLRPLPTCFGPD